MKLFKKLLTIAIALMMVLGLGTRVMAADGDEPSGDTPATTEYDHPLTVTGLSEGDTVKFYQVIKWVGETTDHSDVAGWKAVDTYASVLTKDKLKEVLVGTEADTTVEPPVEAKDPTGITSELAGELAKLATGGVDGTVEGTTATLNNAESGMWMAIVTPADANTVYNPVFVSADYNTESGGTVAMSDTYNGDAVAKKSTLTLDKTATTTEDTWDDNKSYTTAVGDTVNFNVKTTIPGYGEVYTEPHFVLRDSLTDLALNTDSVTLVKPTGLKKKGDEGVEDEDADYEVNATSTGYTITFTEKYLKTVKAATDVEVTYSAIVTSTALKAVNEEDNDVYIEYSHDPNNQSDYDIKKDTTQHYTFSLDAEGAGTGETVTGKKTSEIVKVGVDAAGNPIKTETQTSAITSTENWEGPLEGATFGLFTDAAGTVPYKAKNADGTPGETPMTATTGSDGRMNFKGLDVGTYYLKELSAPAGYVTNSTPVEVVISAEYDTVTVTEWFKDGQWSSTDNGGKKVEYETQILKEYKVTIGGQETAKYTFTNASTANSTDINWEEAVLVEKPYQFENTQGTELPSTGGMGTTLFYTIGGMLVIGAGILLVSRRRMAE